MRDLTIKLKLRASKKVMHGASTTNHGSTRHWMDNKPDNAKSAWSNGIQSFRAIFDEAHELYLPEMRPLIRLRDPEPLGVTWYYMKPRTGISKWHYAQYFWSLMPADTLKERCRDYSKDEALEPEKKERRCPELRESHCCWLDLWYVLNGWQWGDTHARNST